MPNSVDTGNAPGWPTLVPAPFEHQPGLRALMMFSSLPPKHMTFLVDTDAFEPHLRRGEFAVVDLSDHAPANRELFLMSFTSGRRRSCFSYSIVQMRERREFRNPDGAFTMRPEKGAVPATYWTACFWMPPESKTEYARARSAGMIGTSDGPYTTEHASQKLVGRIVGVFVPAVAEIRSVGGAHV